MASCVSINPARLAAANIHPETGLATDYLNHFNEAAMLVDLYAADPGVGDEILAWRPMSYAAHFEASGFREKALAIAAYEAADPQVRSAFDTACAAVEAEMAAVQAQLADGALASTAASDAACALYALIAAADGCIHGRTAAPASQDAIDALFA
jgi:hypothetical protein